MKNGIVIFLNALQVQGKQVFLISLSRYSMKISFTYLSITQLLV
ncbi:hypothetical protein SAMN05661091_3948 [Paenibacillus uliginis N3/975]|uniref:Uncharacterized protein n=1 Tax=Paenibacillus uliginis N3/975 TaxID=1313296 RepID=A0A1X7HJK1_9BACL|nr:hypothetical protein SAMN05661091_3948 [Paenibacillus uliginis N3/975]